MARPPRKRTDWLQIGSGKSYFHRVHQPLQCLIFITPLLLYYQIASTIQPYNTEQGGGAHIIAFLLMLRFFSWFGVAGNYFPLLSVVAILLSWHLARKDKWSFDPKLYSGMAGESIIWAIPVLVIGMVVTRNVAGPETVPAMAQAVADVGQVAPKAPSDKSTLVMLSIGAGVYEELLFRLIAITLLNVILVDVFEVKIQWAIPIIIVASAVLFSGYHYLGKEPFEMGRFLFRTGMGIYFAGIYIYRGFGIVVGAHAVYDLILVPFQH